MTEHNHDTPSLPVSDRKSGGRTAAHLRGTQLDPDEQRALVAARIAGFEAKLSDSQKVRYNAVPLRARFLAAKVMSGSGSKTESVKLKCLDCVGFEDVQEQVGNCKIKSCGLWHHRPFSKRGSRNNNHDSDAGQDTNHC